MNTSSRVVYSDSLHLYFPTKKLQQTRTYLLHATRCKARQKRSSQ